MTPEFAYLLKVNVAFVLFYAFYRLFLAHPINLGD